MKKNAMRKNLLRTIRGSFGRFTAIMAIIALGAAIFVGLLTTKSDMVATGQKYMDEQNMFDLRLLSTYGWTDQEVDAVARMEGVACAEGAVSVDVIASSGDHDAVYKLHSIPEQVSKVYLLGGRMPQSPDECLVDGAKATDTVLGTQFVISRDNGEQTLDSLLYDTYTVVGYVSTPLYMDISRGNTSIGNGDVATYVYLMPEAFRVSYYTEIAVRIQGSYAIYSDKFNNAMQDMAQALRPAVTVLAQDRFAALKAEGETEYSAGIRDYQQGLADYQQGREEVLRKLADGLKELEVAQTALDSNRKLLEDGLQQLQQGQKLLDENALALLESRRVLYEAKADTYEKFAAASAELMGQYKAAATGMRQVEDGITELDSGIAQIQDGLTQAASGLQKLDAAIALTKLQLSPVESALELAKQSPETNGALIAELEAQLGRLNADLAEYEGQRQQVVDAQAEYGVMLEDLQIQRQTLLKTKKELEDGLNAINDGMLELQNNRTQAEDQFAAAEAQLESGRLQLEASQKELDGRRTELEAGMEALEEAREDLEEGRAAYAAGKAEAERELADGQAKLEQARTALADARATLDAMAPAEVFILDRNTNVGYLALDNNSDIVAGVSRVFPAFFLLVAALVCITTMTRMVEEERTQIGIFKALGYSSGRIIGKYLFYAGSAAVLGCGLGVVLGSCIFPTILWDVYGLILNITPKVVLRINWPLCAAVVAVYTAVMMLVTWYCCRRTLREVPADLIRPKAPASGKKIWLEYLPFWKRIGFLNKVMLRNVFRYRQRMLMMLVGIGGCTALLLTGFGLRDSIVNIAAEQFENVTTYDMEVYFSQAQSDAQQEEFRESLRADTDNILFFYQTSAELDFDNAVKEVSLIAAQEQIRDFVHFRRGDEELGMPGPGEAFLTIGTAEALGVRTGDTVTLRCADQRSLTVKITGIYENKVYNYVVALPETLEAQWGQAPGSQMAYVSVRQGKDVHEAAARISGTANVANVSVSEDLARQVRSMLNALNAVVVTVVICAGALAVIVLYNLTNINITERIREIATIKVLGFRAGESAAYVFKENLLLSGMGVFVGLFAGRLLLEFVMSQINIDMVWFEAQLAPLSVVLSVILTMLAACVVDFVLYFKLEKINMAEALKSVE